MYVSHLPATRTTTLRVAAPLLFALTVGCYAYQPGVSAQPGAGHRVRLTLTDSGATSFAAQLGPSTLMVTGRVIQHSSDTIRISVLETRTRNDRELGWAGEEVRVPREMVAGLEERRFSRSRTLIASVALAAAAIVLREAFWGPGSAFGGGNPGGNPGPR